jgi:glycyl-tRNA synthetase beta chain
MADKLDTLAGMFAAGERPTGSRDPYGLRRAAQGLLRILIDLPELTGIDRSLALGPLVDRAGGPWAASGGTWRGPLETFLVERLRFVLEQRGSDVRNVRAVTHHPVSALVPLHAKRLLEVLPEFTGTEEFRTLALVFKRVRNIARNLPDEEFARLRPEWAVTSKALKEPAERTLMNELESRRSAIESAADAGTRYREALAAAAGYGPPVEKFFVDVLVMTDDAKLRQARLFLMRALEAQILRLADVSEIVAEEAES